MGRFFNCLFFSFNFNEVFFLLLRLRVFTFAIVIIILVVLVPRCRRLWDQCGGVLWNKGTWVHEPEGFRVLRGVDLR